MNKPEHVYETYVRATPEAIWRALTSSEFTRQYFHNCSIQSNWTQGSSVHYSRADGSAVMEGRVLEAREPHKLSYTWRFVYDPELEAEGDSRVTFDIEPMGEVCRLRMIHDQFPSENKTYEHISGGWGAILSSLKSLLETGQALPIAGNDSDDAQGGAV